VDKEQDTQLTIAHSFQMLEFVAFERPPLPQVSVALILSNIGVALQMQSVFFCLTSVSAMPLVLHNSDVVLPSHAGPFLVARTTTTR